MNRNGGFFSQLAARISRGLRRFMEGRYGNDRLNMVILGAGLVACLLQIFVPAMLMKTVFWALSYVLMFWAILRCLSRNTYKRYQENRKFLQLVTRVKDREHRYYDCPKCRQLVRVPRGKGKIAITCPKCGEKFLRKT
jgi:ssDNA-binding Zn-finger/Zn-ribbon topoisomerase 1